jgi:prepilin-type processing-associated H-X9-DG protein
MYCDDNDDRFCDSALVYFASSAVLPGEQALARRVGLRWCNGNVCLRDHPEYGSVFFSYIKDARALICPTFSSLAKRGSEDPWYKAEAASLTNYRPWYNYTMNGYLGNAWSEVQATRVHKRAEVKSPSATYVFAEESPLVDTQYHGWGLNNTSLDPGTDGMVEQWFRLVGPSPWKVVPGQDGITFYDIIGGFHHAPSGKKVAGKGNCAFVDGHVAAHSRLETFALAWPHSK